MKYKAIFLMSEIKPLTLVSGCNLSVLISEHPKNKCLSQTHTFKCGWHIVFLILAIFSLSCIILASAKDQSVYVAYSFSNNTSVEKTIDFSSFLLKVNTDRNANCKYSYYKGTSYTNLEGNFDLSYGRLHEKSFTNLGDGIYKYYIKCIESNIINATEPMELEIVLRVNDLVKAQILLPEEEPLKAGKIEITLLTSKIVSQTPSLSYSFDSLVYNPLPLIGSEKIWKGYLIIPKDSGEEVVSFKFKANDLEGRQGEEITSGNAFVIDTIKPRAISNINAIGYEGKIKLEWHIEEEDIQEFNVYRAASPNIDYTYFYISTDESPFYDNSVEKGKTYYYRVAAVDKAGNEADLSKEVYATALLTNDSSILQGLALELRGGVDNFLTEIDSIISEVENIKNSISLKQDAEKNLFLNLRLDKELDNSRAELNALRRDAENYKLQDLTKEELNKKLDSSRIKLNIIKMKIPESLMILETDTRTEEISEENIRSAILELEPISEIEIEKSVKETFKIIEESKLSIKSNFYIAEIVFLDGTKKEISVIERSIAAELEKKENTSFVEIVPKEIAGSASEIDIKSLDYNIVKEDPVISFSSDTKKILYSFNKKLSLSSLKEIKISLACINKQEESSKITGYFLLANNLGKREYIGILIGIVLFIALLIYFLYLRKNKHSELFFELSRKIEEAKKFLKKGNIEQVKEIYSSIKKDYGTLNEKEKSKIYRKIGVLQNKIKKENGN